MRALAVLFVTVAALSAQAQESGYIMEYEDIGGVVVYEDTSAAAAQQAAGAGAQVYQEDEGVADDGQYTYFGPHPDGQGGFDATEGAHTHDYAPFDPYLFTQENGYYYFIGDPVDFGYAGNDVYGYYGPHPIALPYGGGYCYYGGYHRHRFAPWSRQFLVSNGWHVWNGPVSPWFMHYRDRYAQYFRDTYPRHFSGGAPIVRDHRQGKVYMPPIQRMHFQPTAVRGPPPRPNQGPTIRVPSGTNRRRR